MDSEAENKLFQTLGNIQGTQDAILKRLDSWSDDCKGRLVDCNRTFAKLDDRVDKIEAADAASTKKITTIAATISTVIATMAAAVMAWFGYNK